MVAEKKLEQTKSQPQPKNNTQLASLAHLSFLTVLIIGPFSIVIPLIIWLLERNKPEKSSFVEFQAKQAFFYQLAIYLITAILGALVGILSIIIIGLLFIPLLILFPIVAVIYGVYAGIQVWSGIEFRYIYLADFIEA